LHRDQARAFRKGSPPIGGKPGAAKTPKRHGGRKHDEWS
jgi:hypothetical protein